MKENYEGINVTTNTHPQKKQRQTEKEEKRDKNSVRKQIIKWSSKSFPIKNYLNANGLSSPGKRHRVAE